MSDLLDQAHAIANAASLSDDDLRVEIKRQKMILDALYSEYGRREGLAARAFRAMCDSMKPSTTGDSK